MTFCGKDEWTARGAVGRRKREERGSALLIVLVFAAVVAIMLYRELPIAAFEAQRQKEQLLVSRGNEYKRGVKLFVKKIGRFPSSIDELENTNRMRFLRHRYVDPLTGKDDWRLIHAGPGGVILDSKVAHPNSKTNASTLGQGATFAGFNNSFSGDTAAAAALAADNTPSAGMRQRPAATQNAASGVPDAFGALPSTTDPTTTPQANLQGIDPATGQAVPNGQGTNGSGAALSTASQITSLADQLNNTNPQTPQQAQMPQQAGSGLSNTSAFGNSTNQNGNPGNGTSPNGAGGVGNQGPTVAGQGITTGGGIAGVASNAEGKGIKRVNDQKKYKLWEFYYDMQKDLNQNAAGALPQNAGTNNNTNNNNGSAFGNNNGSAFGQNSQQGQSQSSFGSSNSSFGSSGSFGSNTNGSTQPTSQQPTSPPQP